MQKLLNILLKENKVIIDNRNLSLFTDYIIDNTLLKQENIKVLNYSINYKLIRLIKEN